jgi:mono/diheme cytochrome c family protein
MEVAVLKKTVFVLLASLLFAFPSWAQNQAPKPDNKISPAEASKANPVKPTPESLAKARKTYRLDCAMCHGENGDAKGDLAADMKNVTDFTKTDSLKDQTDGELFQIIKKGKGDMPPEGDRAKTDDIWNLVNYIRAFAKK